MNRLSACGLIPEYDEITGRGTFVLLSEYRTPMARLYASVPKGAVWSMELGRWYPRRSTGPESQNHHVNGHCQQIAMATGHPMESIIKGDMNTVKGMVKIAALDMGYPFITYRGKVIPKSEAEANTAECALLIEAAHLLAAELNIRLREE